MSISPPRSHMFGPKELPFDLSDDALTISVALDGNLIDYRRQRDTEEVTRKLIGPAEITLEPVEPVLTPKALTHFLLLSFEEQVVLRPKAIQDIFTTFPIEAAVFASARGVHEAIDIIPLLPQKYTLYGDAATGKLCKYWSTPWWLERPAPEYGKGMLRLTLENATSSWISVGKVVLNALGMRLYYNDELVTMVGRFRVLGRNLAETECFDTPLLPGMIKSHKLVEPHVLTVSRKFVMEGGL